MGSTVWGGGKQGNLGFSFEDPSWYCFASWLDVRKNGMLEGRILEAVIDSASLWFSRILRG